MAELKTENQAGNPYAGLPRRVPDDVEQMARAQAVPPWSPGPTRVELWPDPEFDQFLETLKRWRQGEE